MNKYTIALSGLVLAAGVAHAQPAETPADDHVGAHAEGALPADDAAPPAPASPATPAAPADAVPATPADAASAATVESTAPAAPSIVAAEVSEAEIDSFAKATVKLQAIQADATIAADQKQAAMQAAVTESGLDPAQYNAIGKAAQADPELRAKVQTAMSRHTTAPPSDG